MKVNVPTTTHLTFCMAIFDYKIVQLPEVLFSHSNVINSIQRRGRL